MPDFEALIRHQQLKQPSANKRLKVVKNQKTNSQAYESRQDISFLSLFFIGFTGSIIGALTVLFLDINQLIPIEFLKIN